MDIRLVFAAAAGVAALALPAAAHTVNCANESSELQEALRRLPHSSTITIKGNCVGNVTVATDGLSFVAHLDGGSITGQVEVTAQRVKFTGIDIMGPDPTDPGTIIRGGLVARDGASVSFTKGTIGHHTKTGVVAVRTASIVITDAAIIGNGTAGLMNASDGVQAADGGSIQLGAQDTHNDPIPDAAVEVAQNAFRGLLAVRGGSIRIHTANVHDNGAQAAVASFSGSMRITGGSLSAPTPASGTPFDAVLATLGGTVDIENDTGSPLGNTTITGGNGGVLALDSGAARLRGVSITTSAGSTLDPAVGAFRSGSLRLQGANTILNTGHGAALSVGDAASARIDDGSASGFTSGANLLSGAVGVFNAGFLRIADANPGSSITGNFTVSVNSLLALQRGTIAGDISVFGPSTLSAGPGPVNFSGTIHCINNPSALFAPTVFNPPAACSP